jgi:hypothetical protein
MALVVAQLVHDLGHNGSCRGAAGATLGVEPSVPFSGNAVLVLRSIGGRQSLIHAVVGRISSG